MYNNMSESITYVTSDLYLTSYLKVKGFKFKVEKIKNKFNFIFEEVEDLTNHVNEYLTESGSCEPLTYTNAIKNIKNLLFNIK
jgi:hypothetical protein